MAAAELTSRTARQERPRRVHSVRPRGCARSSTRARRVLKTGLAAPCPVSEYPYGYSNAIVRGVARSAGYDYGYAVRNTMTGPKPDLFRLPRLTVHRSTDLAEFRRLVDGRFALTTARDRAHRDLLRGASVKGRAGHGRRPPQRIGSTTAHLPM